MNWEKIRREFETTDIKLKDLANKYGIKPTTLRSRKNREKWQRNASKNVATENDRDLSPQQELFAQLVGGHRMPLYRAYQEAYSATKPSLATAMANSF